MVATFSQQLSAKLVDGKKQVLIRVTFSKTNRVSLKTGIYVYPSYYINGVVCKTKPGRKNMEEAQVAEDAYFELDSLCRKISRLAEMVSGRMDIIEKVWLETVLDLDATGQIDLLDSNTSLDTISNLLNPTPTTSVLVSSLPENSISADSLSDSIYNFFDQFCKSHQIAKSREVNYKTLKSIVYRYEQFEQLVSLRSGFCFSPDTITTSDVIGIRDYMRREADLMSQYPQVFDLIIQRLALAFPYQKKQARGYGINNKSENYVIGMMKKLRVVQNWLNKTLKLTSNNPFLGVNLGVEQKLSHPIYLTKEERMRLATFDLRNNMALEAQRDIFIFQCMTGCRYDDLRNLTPMNVNGSILEYIPSKSCRSAQPPQPRVPLTVDSLETIARYTGQSNSGKLLPCTTLTQYNSDLKVIFKLCGLNRMVYVLDARNGKEILKPLHEVASSHLARRTFVGIAYKMTKDPNIIASMSGHVEGSRAFDRYRDIDDEIRLEVIDLIK